MISMGLYHRDGSIFVEMAKIYAYIIEMEVYAEGKYALQGHCMH
jgi:hypothetical protein